MRKTLYAFDIIFGMLAVAALVTVALYNNKTPVETEGAEAAKPEATPAVEVSHTEEEGPNEFQTSLMQLGFQVFKTPIEAPDFTLADLDGADISLRSYKGKVVLLNFWATWCPPCRAEMPSIEEMYGELKDRKFEILAVDVQESLATVKDFIEENEYTFPILLDTNGSVGAVYGARSIPTTYLIDTNGYAVGFLVGSREWNDEGVYAAIETLMSKAD